MSASSAKGRYNAFASSHGARIHTSRSSSVVGITDIAFGWIGLARAKAKGIKLGRGNKRDGERSADEKRRGKAELEKRILRLYKVGTGIVKIGKTFLHLSKHLDPMRSLPV